jgi:Coproporphyrinogen III oxidase and related Fe-S oxidoreductases
LLKVNWDSFGLEHLEQDILADVRLEGPHRGIGGIQFGQGGLPAAVLEVIFRALKTPGVRARIMLRDPMIELSSNAPNGSFVPNVCRSQSSRSHPAQMAAKLGYDHCFTHARGFHTSGHSTRRAAVDANVGMEYFSSLCACQA